MTLREGSVLTSLLRDDKVRGQKALGWLSLVGITVGLYLAFIYAPEERTLGVVQRIFYIHVPSAWNAFFLFGLLSVASIAYLKSRRLIWNEIAVAAGEIGVVFTTLALATGSIWGRPVWNTWWTWDPKLTTTLILWFIYVAYLVIQASDEGDERRARLAAVFGIIGIVDIPIIHASSQLWRSIHPVVIEPGRSAMPASMAVALLVCVAAFTTFGLYLVAIRLETGLLAQRVRRLKLMLRGAARG